MHFPDISQAQIGKCPRCGTRFLLDDAAPDRDRGHTYSLTPGTTFSGLRIERPLGARGMAEVYLATQLSLERLVAVKILPEWLSEKPQGLARFHREAKVLAELKNPNIVSVIDRGETDDGRHYIVMDYIDGENLRRRMTRKKLSCAETVQLISALCDALEHAHERGVVHRDLKPGNILFDTSGRPHVADFGLARLAGEHGVVPSVTMSNAVVGTRGYMSPEQLASSKYIDRRTDIFALGVILYELLTGELPVGAWSPPSAARQDIGPVFDDVVARALKPDPEQRYESAKAMAQAIRQTDTEPQMGRATRILSRVWPDRHTVETPKTGMSPRAIGAIALGSVAVALALLFAARTCDRQERVPVARAPGAIQSPSADALSASRARRNGQTKAPPMAACPDKLVELARQMDGLAKTADDGELADARKLIEKKSRRELLC